MLNCVKSLPSVNRNLIFLRVDSSVLEQRCFMNNSSAISKLIKLNTKSNKSVSNDPKQEFIRHALLKLNRKSSKQTFDQENKLSKPTVLDHKTIKLNENTDLVLNEKQREPFKEDLVQFEEEERKYNRKPIFSNRKDGLSQTINVFRDLDSSYHFLKLQPPLSSSPPEVNQVFWFKFATHTRDKLDLLEAWNHATTINSSESSSDWENTVQDHLVSQLCQVLPEYSYDQLADITYNLGQLNNRPDQLDLLTSLVDSNLTCKMKERLKETNVTEADIDQSLRIAFAWLRRGMETDRISPDIHKNKRSSPSRLKGLHNIALVKILLTNHLDLLTPSHLVFCLFLAGVHREFPYCINDLNPGMGFPLPPPLYTKLSTVLPLLTEREVGVVCHSLHQCHLYLLTEHHAVKQAAIKCLQDFPASHIVRDQFTVSGVAKFLKKRGSENNRAVVSIMDKYRPYLFNLNNYTKLRLLQFILPGKPSPEDSKQFVSELYQSMSGQMELMRLKDLEQLAFCLFFLNHRDLIDRFAPEIAQAMLVCNWDNVRSGRSFVYLVTTLARMGRWEVDSINQIIEKANKCKMNRLHTDSGLASAIQFLFDLNIPFQREIKTTFIISFIQRNRILCRNSLFQVLELDCIRELHNHTNCERLDPRLRKTLTNYFHSLPEFQSQSNFNVSKSISSRGRLDDSNFNEQTMNFVQRDLAIILGGPDRVWCGHPFPHSSGSVIVFAKDKQTGIPVSLPPGFSCYTSRSIISRIPDLNLEWTAVVVPAKNLMDWQGNQFGHVGYKLEHLNMLGYKTKVVNWVDYFRAMKERNNFSYLRRLLDIRKIKN